MDIVAIINYKGGVGKTSVTANLAAELAYRGKKVLLLDTDAQASLTFSFITPDKWDDEYKKSKTIKSWFDSVIQGVDQPSLLNFIMSPVAVNDYLKKNGKSGIIDLICSHLGLINVDLELATLLGGVNIPQSKKKYIKVHGKMRAALKALAHEKRYDIVLIDCPPNFNIVTKNAIIAAQKILVPAKPDYLSTLGIDYLHRSVRDLVKEFNEYATFDGADETINPEIMGVVFTMIQISSGNPISAQQQFISQTKRLGVKTFNSHFRENKTIFADAPQNLIPVVLNHYSNQTYSTVVEEIEQFVDEFEKYLGGEA
jgi:chromosome partitioning protein